MSFLLQVVFDLRQVADIIVDDSASEISMSDNPHSPDLESDNNSALSSDHHSVTSQSATPRAERHEQYPSAAKARRQKKEAASKAPTQHPQRGSSLAA